MIDLFTEKSDGFYWLFYSYRTIVLLVMVGLAYCFVLWLEQVNLRKVAELEESTTIFPSDYSDCKAFKIFLLNVKIFQLFLFCFFFSF